MEDELFDPETYFDNLDVKMNPETQKIWDLIDAHLLATTPVKPIWGEYYFLRWDIAGEPWDAQCLPFDSSAMEDYVSDLIQKTNSCQISKEEQSQIDWELLSRKSNFALTQAIKQEDEQERAKQEAEYEKELLESKKS